MTFLVIFCVKGESKHH